MCIDLLYFIFFFFKGYGAHRDLHSSPTRRSPDLLTLATEAGAVVLPAAPGFYHKPQQVRDLVDFVVQRVVDHLGLDIALVKRSEEHTSELQSQSNLVCRLLLEKKNT